MAMNVTEMTGSSVAAEARHVPASLDACRSLVDVMVMRAVRHGDDPALIFLNDGADDETRWTYADLFANASRIAVKLNALGARGKRAVLLYEPGLEYIAAFLGTLQAGVVAVTSYPPSGTRAANRLFAIIDDARPDIILSTARIRDAEANLRGDAWAEKAIEWTATDELPEPADPDGVPVVRDQELAMLQYTSGSTGAPKGVMVTHANLMSQCRAAYAWLKPDPERTGCSWLPPYHDMGLMGGILQPVFEGFPVVLMSPMHFIQRPVRWLRAMSKYRSTATGAPNFAFDLCVDQVEDDELEGIDLSALKVAFCGAEPVRMATLKRFADRFAAYGFREEALNPCYGLAEATLMVSGKPAGTAPSYLFFDKAALDANAVVPVPPDHERAQPVASCGGVAQGLEVRIVDPETFEPVASGGVGEIWVTGGHVAAGYWNREAETETTFQARIAGDARSYMRTGDLGFLHNGGLFVTGRIKDVIIIAGRNHYPQDIELTVQGAHPALRPNGIAAFSVDRDGEESLVIVAEVRRLRRSSGIDVAEVRRAVTQEVIRAHGVGPADIHFGPVGTVPLTTSGKVQRQGCKRGYLEGTLRPLPQSMIAS